MSTSHVTPPRGTRRKPAMAVLGATEPAVKTGYIAAAAAQPAPRRSIDPETRWQMVAVAAYYCAERRGFAPGGELQDWLDAEAQVETLVGK